jgi:outer membrane protein assembly factor BamB
MTITRRLLVPLAGLALAVPSGAADRWAEFRGPSGTGHSDATGLPREWSETENVAWKSAVHGRGWSSPVVLGGQVWLTTATRDGRELSVLAFDRETGKVLHDILLFRVEKPEDTASFNSFASPTPVIEEGRIYVHFGSYGTAALDTETGEPIWTRRDLPCNHWRGPGSSPILHRDLLIVHFDGYDLQYAVALD